ncbi:MAG: NAD(P)/FAD-dependent oxidoreductase [Zavarzinia sp.]|nr:NAD(P)/FAD-dependent oxidoreductase [Zavarzinia sp.]
MSHVVILGAGLGGVIMAYEMLDRLGPDDRLTVVNKGARYCFVPSNPWVAVGWREAKDICVDLAGVFETRGIELRPEGARRVHPERNAVELNDGEFLPYDYLVIATGPELAFDEVPGLGPAGHTQSICEIDHALAAGRAVKALMASPGPVVVGAAAGASCYGPAYEFAFVLDAALRKAKLRDRVPMTFVTPEPYIGHLGLDGVGDTRGMLESALRNRHIKWLTNSVITGVEAGRMAVQEFTEDGTPKATHDLVFALSMILPAFRGVAAVRGIEGLVNPRGFVLVDSHQRNAAFPNVFAIGVCVAIPPVGQTAIAVGVPKTGFMIESMARAAAANIEALLAGKAPRAEPTLNAVCLADFGDDGIAFVAEPQIPPRNVNWAARGAWVHAAKVGFESYFLHKVRAGEAETFYEKLMLDLVGIHKLKESGTTPAD